MRLRQTWPDKLDDFTLLTDDGCATGRIHMSPGAAGTPNVWQWHATLLYPGSMASSGRAETREDAMAAFKAMWELYGTRSQWSNGKYICGWRSRPTTHTKPMSAAGVRPIRTSPARSFDRPGVELILHKLGVVTPENLSTAKQRR